jgi:hypothetical protein
MAIVNDELAVRVAILSVAEAGTFLRKVDSPGRLYESVTASEITGGAGTGIKHFFAWGDVSSTLIREMESGSMINSIYFVVKEAFNGVGAAVTIGTVADPDLLVPADEVDLTIVGTYLLTPGYSFTVDTEIKVFNTPGSGASTGTGIAVINF